MEIEEKQETEITDKMIEAGSVVLLESGWIYPVIRSVSDPLRLLVREILEASCQNQRRNGIPK